MINLVNDILGATFGTKYSKVDKCVHSLVLSFDLIQCVFPQVSIRLICFLDFVGLQINPDFGGKS